MNTLLSDLRYGARILLKRPGFALVVVLTLAIGIGANTAIFTVVNAALLKSLPYRDPGNLVQLWETQTGKEFDKRGASYPDFLDWKRDSKVFESVGGYSPGTVTVADRDSPDRVSGVSVTANFLDVLGVQPLLGRSFAAGEDQPGAARTAIISYGLWTSRYGSDPQITSRQITVDGDQYSIVGVLPREFSFAAVGDAAVWVPISPDEHQITARYYHWLNVVARLKPGVSINTAQAQMQTVAHQIAEADAQNHGQSGIGVVSLQEDLVGSLKPILLALLGAVGLVLLIACANVANLLLARSSSRRKEVAIRIALGARRARLIRQLLTESVLLSLVGGGLGLILALWCVDILIAAIPQSQIIYMPYLQGLRLNPEVLFFTLGLSLLTGIVFGLTPAISASNADLNSAMREGTRASSSRGMNKVRSGLVVLEVALALMLLTGAGLLIKSLSAMLRVDPGFNSANLLTMRISLPGGKYSDGLQAAAFQTEMLDHIRQLPGVAGAATVNRVPLSGAGQTGNPSVVGRPVAQDEASSESFLRTISPDYFHVMGIPIQTGRFFSDRDKVDSPRAVIINQTLSRNLFPDGHALGEKITFKFTADQPPFEIVGVVADEKIASLDTATRPAIYFPYLQDPETDMSIVVRTMTSPENLSRPVIDVVHSIEKDAPVYSVMSMDTMISNARETFLRRYPAYLMGIFACVALLLSMVGIYGVITYSVSQRTDELAIRIALGAGRADIIKLVLRQGMLLVAIGILAGLAGAAIVVRLMTTLLFNVSAADPATLTSVAVILVVVALIACYIPALRATRVDPISALRAE